MSRSFGPVVITDPTTCKVMRVHCNWCIFRTHRDGAHACGHPDRNNLRTIPDPSATPDWCEMKAGNVRDAEDMAYGKKNYVVRWSGRRTDVPREIYAGIPSEASRQFRLASRDAKRGTVRLEDQTGRVLEEWQIGIAEKTVVALEHSAGRTRRARRPSGQLGRTVVIPLDALETLKPAASARNISVHALIREIISTVADDGMVDAVLDDGEPK